MRERDIAARVLRAIRAGGLLLPGEKALAAVSGGADSVALLLLLLALREELGVTLEAAHFEHGIRGEASRADAAFVEALCRERSVACHVGHGDVPALARQWRVSLETAARRARYAFLTETAARVGAQKIVLAHQLEDQAETLLLHLIRGCGLAGLSAMGPLAGGLARPLLDISRADLEAYLRAEGAPWREDATNLDTAHARNFLRHRVFPALRELNPRVAEAMGRTARQAREAARQLNTQAEILLEGRVKALPYGAFWAVEGICPTAQAARAFARRAGVPEMEEGPSRALAALRPGESLNLAGSWRALRTKTRLHLLGPEGRAPRLSQADFVSAPCAPGDLGDGIRVQAFDAAALEGAAFRFRRPGDVFAPLGGPGTQKLTQTLRDAGVDRPFRDLVPVLAKGERILWIVGVKPARDGAVSPGSERAVKITYKGPLPWEIQGGFAL